MRSTQIIVFLLSLMIAFPACGKTPLMDAARNGDTATVRTLLDKGADVDVSAYPQAETQIYKKVKRKKRGSQVLRFFIPVIDVLKELGGSGKPQEVTDLVIEKLNISEAEQEKTLKNGTSRVRNQIAWARMYLVKVGLIDSSQRGIWTLTEKGLDTILHDEDVDKYYKEATKQFRQDAKKRPKDVVKNKDTVADNEDIGLLSDYKTELLETLKNLPPYGFERICQRLLRESGFEQVVVTGKSGDGGIDGHGILRVNPFVSFKVLFQCKRYQGSVSAQEIRSFQAAMLGRASKGIFITTGSFSMAAKKESLREGVQPIELVDGEKLVEMFVSLKLGLISKIDFDLDYAFFETFKSKVQ